MYNGIGLQTARGRCVPPSHAAAPMVMSSGICPASARAMRRARSPRRRRAFSSQTSASSTTSASARSRSSASNCRTSSKSRGTLHNSRSLPDDEIEARVDALRARLRERQDAVCPSHQETKSLRPSDTHALGAAKKLEREKMERALRIRPDYVEGEAFSPEIQERRKMERKEERARLHEEAQTRWEQRRTERAERDVRVDRQPDIDDPRVSRPPRDARDRGWDSPRDHGWPARRSPSPGAASRTPSPPHTAAPPPPGPPPRRPDASREGPV